MESTFTPLMKWTISGLAVVFVGLGTWLSTIVYRNQNSAAPAESTISTQLPAPVATTLTEPKADAAAPSTPAPTLVSPVPTSTSDTAQTKPANTTTATTVTSTTVITEATLTVSVSTTSMNGSTTVIVTANQPVQAGFGSASGSFVSTQTLRFSGSDTHTLVIRTKGGQEQRFSVAGSSSSSLVGSSSASASAGSASSSASATSSSASRTSSSSVGSATSS